MIEAISLTLGVILAIWIKRKGLTTVELRQYTEERLRALQKYVVRFKFYRWATGHVWIKLGRQGWVQARWCTNATDGYLVKCDGSVGMTHRKYDGITAIEDYSKESKP